MSIVLDVATGVVFLYLLLALLVTTVQELFASVLGLRSANLFDAIESMLTGTFTLPTPAASGAAPAADDGSSAKAAGQANPPLDLVTQLYHHPLIKNLIQDPSSLQNRVKSRNLGIWAKRRLPSYIPSKTFALALLDILRGPTAAGVTATELLTGAQQTIDRIGDQDLKRVLSLFVEKATPKAEDLEIQADRIRDGIEGWFNDRMARASGWYKRKAQFWSVIIAALVVFAFNADTIHVGTRLWNDRTLRDSVVATASAFKQDAANQPDDPKAQAAVLASQTEAIRNAGFPIGWRWIDGGICARLAEPEPGSLEASTAGSSLAVEKCWDASGGDYALLAVGWLITILAVSLGSNFWFDVLGKALQLRGSGPKVSVSTGEVETKKA
jgi:hypothetical protein